MTIDTVSVVSCADGSAADHAQIHSAVTAAAEVAQQLEYEPFTARSARVSQASSSSDLSRETDEHGTGVGVSVTSPDTASTSRAAAASDMPSLTQITSIYPVDDREGTTSTNNSWQSVEPPVLQAESTSAKVSSRGAAAQSPQLTAAILPPTPAAARVQPMFKLPPAPHPPQLTLTPQLPQPLIAVAQTPVLGALQSPQLTLASGSRQQGGVLISPPTSVQPMVPMVQIGEQLVSLQMVTDVVKQAQQMGLVGSLDSPSMIPIPIVPTATPAASVVPAVSQVTQLGQDTPIVSAVNQVVTQVGQGTPVVPNPYLQVCQANTAAHTMPPAQQAPIRAISAPPTHSVRQHIQFELATTPSSIQNGFQPNVQQVTCQTAVSACNSQQSYVDSWPNTQPFVSSGLDTTVEQSTTVTGATAGHPAKIVLSQYPAYPENRAMQTSMAHAVSETANTVTQENLVVNTFPPYPGAAAVSPAAAATSPEAAGPNQPAVETFQPERVRRANVKKLELLSHVAFSPDRGSKPAAKRPRYRSSSSTSDGVATPVVALPDNRQLVVTSMDDLTAQAPTEGHNGININELGATVVDVRGSNTNSNNSYENLVSLHEFATSSSSDGERQYFML